MLRTGDLNEDEWTVLAYYQRTQPEPAQTDSHPDLQAFATDVGRTPGTVDASMRNIKSYLQGAGLPHGSRLMRAVADRYRDQPDSVLARDAAAAIARLKSTATLPPSNALAGTESEINVGDELDPALPGAAGVSVTPTSVEAAITDSIARKGTPPTVAERREHGLVRSYERFLVSAAHVVASHTYTFPTGQRLKSDLVDETDHELVEAKGQVTRDNIRMALGQLLDYRRFETGLASTAVLLPHKPSDDLIDLVLTSGSAVIWQNGADKFDRLEPGP